MNYYFWNSLTNAGGYKAIELANGRTQQIKMPAFIDAELSNGACQIMLKVPSLHKDRCVLIVKGFKYADTNRKFDAQGRDVNINLIIESSKSNCDKLARICVGFLTEWDNCRRYLGESIERADTDLSYNINQTRYEQLLEYLATYSTTMRCGNKTIRLNASSPNMLLGLAPGATTDYYMTMKRTLYSAFKLPVENLTMWSSVMESEDVANVTKETQTKEYGDFEDSVLGRQAQDDTYDEVDNSGNSNEELNVFAESVPKELKGDSVQLQEPQDKKCSDDSNFMTKACKRFEDQPAWVRYLIVFGLGLLVGLFM